MQSLGTAGTLRWTKFFLLVAFNAVPKAVIVWFGIGVGHGILTAFLISFFPITVNMATGLATLAFVGTVLAEMTAGDSGIGYLMLSAGSSQRMPLAFAGLIVIGAMAMAMAMYELFSYVEKHTTAWAHRGPQGE